VGFTPRVGSIPSSGTNRINELAPALDLRGARCRLSTWDNAQSGAVGVRREYPHRMNTQTVAVVCAGLGVIFSVVYVVLGVSGIKLLRDLRDRMSRS
jgi:hypothetical protein